ncbi:MAG: hypothetical protein NT076_03030 [Candidatus Pacearchaeota archaeon]|nr:hypothetical protein [Candidatus Pacearchaeota archaeon]
MKWHSIEFETYKKLTEKCAVCGFDKFVALHHLDYNKANTSSDNLVGLCPNHHQMLHTVKYKEEIFQLLREKGFNPKRERVKKRHKRGLLTPPSYRNPISNQPHNSDTDEVSF